MPKFIFSKKVKKNDFRFLFFQPVTSRFSKKFSNAWNHSVETWYDCTMRKGFLSDCLSFSTSFSLPYIPTTQRSRGSFQTFESWNGRWTNGEILLRKVFNPIVTRTRVRNCFVQEAGTGDDGHYLVWLLAKKRGIALNGLPILTRESLEFLGDCYLPIHFLFRVASDFGQWTLIDRSNISFSVVIVVELTFFSILFFFLFNV